MAKQRIEDLKEVAPCGMLIHYTVDNDTDMITYTDINGRGQKCEKCHGCTWTAICKPAEKPEGDAVKDQMLKIINAHNGVVDSLSRCNIKIDMSSGAEMLACMEVWHKLACEGAEITHTARQHGIDAKVDMQSGRVTVYGDL